MKMGIRKPSIKKSVSARTTGKIKRTIKKTTNPLYGKKGMGIINNPKKAVYNKAYNKTTVSAFGNGNKGNGNKKQLTKGNNYSNGFYSESDTEIPDVNQKILADTSSKNDNNPIKIILQGLALVAMFYGLKEFNFVSLLAAFILLTITNFIMK